MKFREFIEAMNNQIPLVVSSKEYSKNIDLLINNRFSIGVGIGYPAELGAKGLRFTKSSDSRSISESIYADNQSKFEESRSVYALKNLTPFQLIEKIVFYVKDASPDCLLAVLIIVAKLCEVEEMKQLEKWVEVVTTWDEGIMPDDPFKSWPALASALSHSKFLTKKYTEQSDYDRQQLAWSQSFQFLVKSIFLECDPENMSLAPSSITVNARTALRRIEQLYEDICGHAKKMQLSVPLRDSSGRCMMVDTICYVEDESSDAVKVFGRVDLERSPSHRGFALAVSYRPEADSWNKFTIHADPRLSLDLSALWEALEFRETEMWRDENLFITRPASSDAPRTNEFIDVHPRSFNKKDDLDKLALRIGTARQMSNVLNIWPNPWYINHNASLIASPGIDGEGNFADSSKLDWRDIVETIWEVYNPLSSIEINSYYGSNINEYKKVKLTDAEPIRLSPELSRNGPVFRYLDWPTNTEKQQPRSISLNDTTISIFAALASRRIEAPNGKISLAELPPCGASKLVMLNGGFAVLSFDGCTVVDDWHDQELRRDEMFKMFEITSKWYMECTIHLNHIRNMNEKFKDRNDSKPDARIYNLIGECIEKSSHFIAEKEKADSSHFQDDNTRILYESLTNFLGVSRRASHIEQSYKQFEQSLKSFQEVRVARLLKSINIIGVPAGVAASICKPVADFANEVLLTLGLMIVSEKNIDGWLGLGQILSWAFCTAVFVTIMHFLNSRLDTNVDLNKVHSK